MNSLKLRVILDGTLEIHLTEHVQGALLARSTVSTRLVLHGSSNLPARLIALETVRFAVLNQSAASSPVNCEKTYVASSNNLVLGLPDQAGKRQQPGADIKHSPRRLLRRRRIHNRHTAIMARKGQCITAGRERARMNPSGRVIQEFSTDSIKRQPLAPTTRLRPLINPLDIPREHPAVRIRRARRKQDRVGVPRESGDGAADRLLQVLRDPPVVFLLEVADRDDARAGSHGEFLLRGRPPDKGCGAVDAEEDEGGFPAGGGLFPDVCVAVCM